MQDEGLKLLTDPERRLVEMGRTLPAVGFIDDFKQWAARKTDAPGYTLEAAALMALSLAAGDGVVLEGVFSDAEVAMNLYLLIVGQSTVLRKTTVLSYVDGLMPMSPSGKLVTTLDDVSPQALNRALGAAGTAKMPVLLNLDEVAGVFEVQKRSGSYLKGFDKILLKAYDHSPIHVLRANGSIDVPTGAFVNVFGASTPDPLNAVLESEDVESGLLPRFLIFDATSADRGRRRSLMDRKKDDWSEDKKKLQKHIATVAWQTTSFNSLQGKQRVIQIGPEAMKRLDDLDAVLYKEAGQEATAYGAMKGRAFWHVFKLSGLYALSRDPKVEQVEMPDVLRALQTVETCLHDLAVMQQRVSANSFERRVNEVLGYLDSHGGAASIAAVTKALTLGWREAADIQRTLEMRGELQVDAQAKKWRRA
jgi:hypothetical protein